MANLVTAEKEFYKQDMAQVAKDNYSFKTAIEGPSNAVNGLVNDKGTAALRKAILAQLISANAIINATENDIARLTGAAPLVDKMIASGKQFVTDAAALTAYLEGNYTR